MAGEMYPMQVRHLDAMFRARGGEAEIARREDGSIDFEIAGGPWRMTVHFSGRRGYVLDVELYNDGELLHVEDLSDAVRKMIAGMQVPGEWHGPTVTSRAFAKRSNSVETRRATVRRV